MLGWLHKEVEAARPWTADEHTDSVVMQEDINRHVNDCFPVREYWSLQKNIV